MMRFLSSLFKLFLFAVIFIFAVYNFDLVTLRFANVYEFHLPLAVVMFMVFILGLVLGTTMTWVNRLTLKKSQKS